jgi:glycosyltransferase involved in cell wall biosynthesis
MRILYVITRAEPGGAQMHVLHLIRGFRRRHQIALVTGERGFLVREAEAHGVTSFVLPDLIRAVAPWRDARALRQLHRILSSWRPDLIHAHTCKAGLLARIAARLLGLPCVYTAHGFRFAAAVPRAERALAFLGEWTAAHFGGEIICVSQSDVALAGKLGVAARRRINFVHNGVPDAAQRVLYRSSAAGIILVMVARFVEGKDHSCLLQALKRLRATHANLGLWLIGDGPQLDRVKAEAEICGLDDRVVFWGPRADVSRLLAAADILVLASRHEGLPLSILEASRAGLPTVASDVGGVRECVLDGITGLLVPSADVASLAAALSKLLMDPELRARMGHSARKYYEAEFTVERMLAATSAVYRRALQSSGRIHAAERKETALEDEPEWEPLGSGPFVSHA